MYLITPKYCALNTKLHEEKPAYGTSGKYYATFVLGLSFEYNTKDILDYGCGKGTLAQNLPFRINQYDPAIKKHYTFPSPAELVICTDVLEHVEPECLDTVIGDLVRVTNNILYASISTQPALKTLADGRNAHLIVENSDWWVSKFSPHFTILKINADEHHLGLTMQAKDLEMRKEITKFINIKRK